MDTLLHFPGSLLSERNMVASYDIEQGCVYPSLSLLTHDAVLNYARQPFQLNFAAVCTVTVVNGMGVTLGDSVIGIEVLHYLRQRHPGLRVRVLRPCRCADFVEQLYRLALDSGIIDALAYLPQPLPAPAPHEVYIDMGNQLFRNDFATLEMHDFFYRHSGIDEKTVPNAAKQNRWLRCVDISACERLAPEYVLFCPGASTALRAIPSRFHQAQVEHLHQRFRRPILGFGHVDHPHYRNIAHCCRDTLSFIAAIARANFLYAADSSALHIAAGFGIPTRALFGAIQPALRTRYYPACDSEWTGTKATEALHESSDPRTLRAVEENIARLMQNEGL